MHTQHTVTMTTKSRNGDVRDRKPAKGEGVSSNSCSFSDLPTLILLNVFFRLPIKDVMRCKCVCKEWNSLILEPNFSQKYAKNSSFTSIFNCMDPDEIDSVPNVSYLFEISENGDCIQAPFDPKLPGWSRKIGSLSFIGSRNGFVCMKVQKPGVDIIYITNPIMGDAIALPEREIDEEDDYLEIYHFGFCPALNQCKVLRIDYRYFMEGNSQLCDIFTVGVDHTWRRFPDSFPDLSFLSGSVALNEAFHWLPWDNHLDFIPTFDLIEEKFGQISLPPCLLPVSPQVQLAEFGNHLGLVDCSDPSEISLWKLKKYPDVESWSKVSVLRTWLPPTLVISDDPVSAIELKNGDILFSYSTCDFISCNIEQKKCSKIEVDCHERLFYGSLMTFTPNFSSSAELIMKGQKNTLNV